LCESIVENDYVVKCISDLYYETEEEFELMGKSQNTLKFAAGMSGKRGMGWQPPLRLFPWKKPRSCGVSSLLGASSFSWIRTVFLN